MLVTFSNIMNLKNTFKKTLFIPISIYIKTIIQIIFIKTIIQTDKHKAKYIITVCIPIIIIKFFLLFIKKVYNYIKKILHHTIIKKKKCAKYKNGTPRAKFIIK